MFGYIWEYLFTSFLRFWLKWFLRQITGKCELQRICNGYRQGAPRTSRTEYSLESSKSKTLKASVSVEENQVEECVLTIMKEKKVVPQKDPTFKMSLQVCLLQITGYKRLYTAVEDLRKEPFDCENNRHENMLLKLWDLLVPSVKLESRITKQWGDIGFQGDDPKTDFRGMGMLGLTNLLYSYAIVGINLTEMAYSLLKSGALKPHFYNTVSQSPKLEDFHQLYCYLAYEFDKFWIEEKPESIMEFNRYREKFHDKMKDLLEEPDVSLCMTVDCKL
ncbi:hypothetical protein JZ751_012486 [Albula glossodonta]|uniref:ELMO domain-containing protein n=1 Tax=Albula glossodonta TaxID=121402 RepID=A0A8T2NXG0_9TELE|nr:hypothetical protein JZ751_012486 [Albula glossodonta]